MADYTSTGIIHNTSVDFTRRVISEPVHIVQGDRTLPTLAVELLSDGQPYTVPDEAQVNIALNKKDGTFVLNKADSVEGNIATFTVTAQMAAVSGDFTPEVQIVNGAGQATTGKFPYIVDKAEIQEGMLESTSEATSLIDYADRAEKAADRAQEAADKADTVAINTEAAEKAATDAAANATAAATSEKNAADSATAAADSATASANSATAAKASEDAAAQSSASALQSAQLAEQYKNEAFSGTPTGYEDLVNKVNSIYRETASDFASIGTSEGSALAKRIYGMSVQDGTPTPDSPVEIESAKADFKCVGKNLIPYPYGQSDGQVGYGVTFNVGSDGGITLNGTANNTGLGFRIIGGSFTNLSPLLKIKPNQEYIISGTPSGSGSSSSNYKTRYTYIFYNDSGKTLLTGSVYESGATVIAPPTSTKFRIVVDVVKNVVYDGSITCYPMLTLADADQTYEVNQHTDITTDLTLRAIEVTSSDGYNLERDGKYYIADTIDWSEDKGYQITRRVERFNVNKLKVGHNLVSASITNTNWDYTKYILPSTKTIAPLTYSNYFIKTNYAGATDSDGNGKIFFNPDVHLLMIRVDGMTSQADWNTWLSNHSDMYVDLILATPTTEPITSEQAQALLSLKTYDEATSISATGDIEPSLDLEYSKDRNTALALTGHNLGFKNALKLNDINTALTELGGTV